MIYHCEYPNCTKHATLILFFIIESGQIDCILCCDEHYITKKKEIEQ